MKKQILFILILCSIFTLLNSCYFSTKKAVEKRQLEMQKMEEKFELVWSETYEEEGKKITIDKRGKDCIVIGITIVNEQDSTKRFYNIHANYSRSIIPLTLSPGIHDPAIYEAVTDTTNGYYFFDEKVSRNTVRWFYVIEESERKLIKYALSKCNCEEKFGVDYDKIIGWVY